MENGIRRYTQKWWGRQRRLLQACISHRNCWKQCRKKGVQLAYVTLHVGLGTFRPVKEEELETRHALGVLRDFTGSG